MFNESTSIVLSEFSATKPVNASTNFVNIIFTFGTFILSTIEVMIAFTGPAGDINAKNNIEKAAAIIRLGIYITVLKNC